MFTMIPFMYLSTVTEDLPCHQARSLGNDGDTVWWERWVLGSFEKQQQRDDHGPDRVTLRREVFSEEITFHVGSKDEQGPRKEA